MLTRLSVLVCVFAVATTSRAAEPQERLVTVTYQVADLVAPPAPTASGWRVWQEATPADQLIDDITHAVKDASWSQWGGRGSIQYFAPTMSLVVNQTPDIQEQIADQLARMRTEVNVDVRFLAVSEDIFGGCRCDRAPADGLERIGIGIDFEAKGCPNGPMVKRLQEVANKEYDSELLKEGEHYQLMETVSNDMRTNVMSLPKLTLLHGQAGVMCFKDDLGDPDFQTATTGYNFKVRPTVSADRRFVRLEVDVDQKGDNPVRKAVVCQTVVIPDGGTVLLGGFRTTADIRKEIAVPVLSSIPYVNQLFRCVGIGHEPRRVFVLVTPRIVVHQEVEEKVAPVASDACAGSAAACPQLQIVPLSEPLRVQCVAPAAGEPLSRQAKVLADVLRAYDAACEEGRGDEAEKLARAALVLDPACFHRKR